MFAKGKKWLSPTVGRIVLLSVVLTVSAQLVLGYIGISYMKSIEQGMDNNRSEAMLGQFHQNMLGQLNGINNLMLLLQTPEFSDYFRNLMPLRDEGTIRSEERKLLDKLRALNLTTYQVSSIYFIGTDRNQFTYRIGDSFERFEERPGLHMEALRHSQLEQVFLPDHDQFAIYPAAELTGKLRTDSEILAQEDIAELNRFIADIQGKLMMTNGNVNSVFIVILLDESVFKEALPDVLPEGSAFTVEHPDGTIIWSSSSDGRTAQLPGEGDSNVNANFSKASRELSPFRLKVSHIERQGEAYPSSHAGILLKLAGVSLATVIFSLFISLFLMRAIFKPFRLISKKLRNQTLDSSNELTLKSLPDHLFQRGFHAVSMRNKLILVLLVAVSLPSVADGLLFSRLLNDDVRRKIEASVEDIGNFTAISVRNRVQFMENVMNELTVSRQLQNYLTTGEPFPGRENPKRLSLTMFPGLTEVSYFVLLTENGTSSYSSIYSNSKDIFNIDPRYLRSDEDMYWIANFPTVYEQRSAAVVRRIDPGMTGSNAASYLLLVPKESLFSEVRSGLLNAAYEISDASGQAIYRTSDNMPISHQEAQVKYENGIEGTDWTITIHYVLNEVIEKSSVLQGQYLLFMLIVVLLSMTCAFVIANLLVQPIEQLKESMRASGAGDLSTRMDEAATNEIGDIIRSYNGMIARLERTIEQNMNMMEENAQNKIREKELLSMKTRAELLMLQAQINPHFLYNTLESISMQSFRSGNQEISAIVGSLADMFRYSISKGSDVVELSKELEHVRHYLTIQQFRFGGSFEGRFEVPDELMRAPVLKFILQPLIENAIKHGFAGWEEGGWIVVSAVAHDGWITLTVRDNGVGMSTAKLGKLRASLQSKLEERTNEDGGIGLQNVYYRLKLYFQDRMSVEVDSVLMRGTAVRLSFPLEAEPLSSKLA